MNIDDSKQPRAALKSYFVKNAIPTEGQFAQLIDSALNQRDDGLVKAAGDPLSIEAVGDDSSFKKALNFYNSFADADPAWTVSLRPRSTPADPQAGRPGLSINDAAGNSRLSIDSATGRVGIGTIAPDEALDVSGRIKADRLSIGTWPANPAYMYFGTNALDQTAGGNYALLQGATGGDVGRTFLNSPVDIRFRIGNGDRMMIANNGNVGVGTSSPATTLDVNGAFRSQNFFNYRGFRIETGASSPASWQVYAPTGIFVDVNTASAGFTATPHYITALHGNSNHWSVIGGNSVYQPTAQGFRIYVRWADNSALVPATALAQGWYIQWIGIQS